MGIKWRAQPPKLWGRIADDHGANEKCCERKRDACQDCFAGRSGVQRTEHDVIGNFLSFYARTEVRLGGKDGVVRHGRTQIIRTSVAPSLRSASAEDFCPDSGMHLDFPKT